MGTAIQRAEEFLRRVDRGDVNFSDNEILDILNTAAEESITDLKLNLIQHAALVLLLQNGNQAAEAKAKFAKYEAEILEHQHSAVKRSQFKNMKEEFDRITNNANSPARRSTPREFQHRIKVMKPRGH